MSIDNTAVIEAYFGAISSALVGMRLDKIAEALAVLHRARMEQKRVYIFGNGGSAATASHFACDLAKGAIRPGYPRMRVHSLVDSIPLFSAWANDTGYQNVFAEQLRNTVEPGDVVIAISGSGNSPNVLEGVRVARDSGVTVIGFSGFDGGRLAQLADIAIVVPNYCMEQVEDCHLVLTHAMAVCLRQARSNILAVTHNPEELAKIARGYIEKSSPDVIPRPRQTGEIAGMPAHASVITGQARE